MEHKLAQLSYETAALQSGVPAILTGPVAGARDLRVALITDADVFAGTERHMLELASGLQGRGVSVMIVCPSPSPLASRATAAGIPVHSIRRRGFVTGSAALSLRGLLRNGMVDILHAHNGRALLAATLAITLAGRGRCVATQHFLAPSRSHRRGLKGVASGLIHRFIRSKTHHLIAVSQAARTALLARNDIAHNKISVVPNGISAPAPVASELVQSTVQALDITAQQRLIVCAARLETEKGIETLVEAMRIVRQSDPRAVCVIAGDGSCRAALEKQIAGLNLGDAVRLLGFRTDVPALMQAGDLFILPSPAEPFGLVLLEAMAMGKPVVAVAAGGPVEIVVEGQTGLLAPPNDPVAMAKAILLLLGDDSMRQGMGTAGLARWRDEFKTDRMATATIAAYQKAIA